MKHFIQSVNSSKENKHLLILDGHTSHSKNLDTIKLARENGVCLLSFPPHTTHRMQPLDVSFFKSLKNWYNIEVETYLRSSHGKTVNAYLVSKLVGKAFIKAATMESAVNGFRKAGLWPSSRHVFDGEFDCIEALTAPYTDELTVAKLHLQLDVARIIIPRLELRMLTTMRHSNQHSLCIPIYQTTKRDRILRRTILQMLPLVLQMLCIPLAQPHRIPTSVACALQTNSQTILLLTVRYLPKGMDDASSVLSSLV